MKLGYATETLIFEIPEAERRPSNEGNVLMVKEEVLVRWVAAIPVHNKNQEGAQPPTLIRSIKYTIFYNGSIVKDLISHHQGIWWIRKFYTENPTC